MACEAFETLVLHGQRFSSAEMDAIKVMIDGKECPLTGRERSLFEDKLR
jgi:hypothetical protein